MSEGRVLAPIRPRGSTEQVQVPPRNGMQDKAASPRMGSLAVIRRHQAPLSNPTFRCDD